MPELIAEGRAWVGHETTVELIPDRCQVVWVRLRIDGVMEDEVLSYVIFGGYKESGIGRELGETALDNYIQTKTVLIRLGVSVTYSWVKH
ncbi:hypothetical protein HBI56_133560 [Parastagonospora nodorum]|nr:hypothetical protein HBH53_047310 [Parastagonospora nodorum]KAH4201293.1 hypothetical protein HBH42_027640 [Parastagonospora nodorum]KAH4300648.1 hypothetical protein HBI02_151090 [Parastagonospora nodorum]KAH4306961.1 hypothetical protein HBI01_053810 [Parastagonospora nodorum]KAH4337088.1 hypothetical protein HBI00_017450 [Parastagonospora nodorum]